MTALAHPGTAVPAGPAAPSWGPTRRRRHLALVPAPAAPEPDLWADVLELPLRAVPGPTAGPGPLSAPLPALEPLRLTVRGRRVVVGLVLALAAVLGGTAGAVLGGGEAVGGEVAEVTVQPGQTLWAVAVAATPAGGDVRVVVDEIMELNAMSTSAVAAGQVLSVPAED